MISRIKLRVEEAVMRFKGDPVLWIKDKTGKEADPWQIIAMKEIKDHPRCVHNWPPRFGKTWAMEAVCLEETATNSYERELIFAPGLSQSNNALKEQLNFIEESPILSAWIANVRGKRQISETKYEFINHSSAQTFGIRSNFDSENATIIRGEEFDDIDLEIWNNRVIQRGGRKNISGLPLRIRLSGTIQWGKGPIFIYVNNPNYHTITKFDIYDGMQFGIYDEIAVEEYKQQLTDDQWLRIFLLIFTDTKNFIWESNLRACLQEALKLGWNGIEYEHDGQYRPRGNVYAGIDMGHSGEGKKHSVYRMDIIEQIGDTVLWLYGKEWESTVDPEKLKEDICELWRFYGIDGGAYGDALKANDIAIINDQLFDRGLVEMNRAEYPENKPSDWEKWSFTPKWNTGKFKYLAGGITKVKIDNKKFIIPYFDSKDDRYIAKMARNLKQSLLNIRQINNNSTYPTLEHIKDEIGDDPFDAINMAMACANDKMLAIPDLSLLGVQGNRTVTSGMITGIINQLQKSHESFSDFIN